MVAKYENSSLVGGERAQVRILFDQSSRQKKREVTIRPLDIRLVEVNRLGIIAGKERRDPLTDPRPAPPNKCTTFDATHNKRTFRAS